MPSVFESALVKYELRGDLLVATYKKGGKFTIASAKEVVRDRLAFTNNRNLCVLIHNAGVVSMDREARAFFSSPDGTKGVKAAAIIMDSVYTSILGNFMIEINRPPMPSRLFRSEEKAIAWLKKFDK